MELRINRKFISGSILVMLLVILYLPLRAVETQANAKKLIEYGWDAPTPDFFRQQIKAMEKRPFDGVIVKLNAGKEVFKKTAYPDTAFAQDRQDLAATKSSNLTDNFLVMWAGMDAGWDWFNDADWAAAEKNIYNFATTAKIGHFRGIAFDAEPYSVSPWIYEKQTQHQTKTLQAYQKQVRKRGGQFMQALQSGQPGTQVLTLGLLSWMKWLTRLEPAKLAQELAKHPYGLWPAFINGMLDVVQSSSAIIDGNEWAYYFSSAAAFDKTRDTIFQTVRKFVDPVNDQKYAKQVKIGQSVFIDLLINLLPLNVKTSPFVGTVQNLLPPETRLPLLEHNIYHSLRTTDRYSWVYSEQIDWWKNNIPTGVEMAIRSAKEKINRGKQLGFNIDAAVKKAVQECQLTNKDCF
jgi:hypothetical protein